MIDQTIEQIMGRTNATIKCAEAFEWSEWVDKIPYIHFPSSLDVKAVPPLNGATIRYRVKPHGIDESTAYVSIYLDCYDSLGSVGSPYWEIYPNEGGNTERFYMHEHKEMIKAVEKSIMVQVCDSK